MVSPARLKTKAMWRGLPAGPPPTRRRFSSHTIFLYSIVLPACSSLLNKPPARKMRGSSTSPTTPPSHHPIDAASPYAYEEEDVDISPEYGEKAAANFRQVAGAFSPYSSPRNGSPFFDGGGPPSLLEQGPVVHQESGPAENGEDQNLVMIANYAGDVVPITAESAVEIQQNSDREESSADEQQEIQKMDEKAGGEAENDDAGALVLDEEWVRDPDFVQDEQRGGKIAVMADSAEGVPAELVLQQDELKEWTGGGAGEGGGRISSAVEKEDSGGTGVAPVSAVDVGTAIRPPPGGEDAEENLGGRGGRAPHRAGWTGSSPKEEDSVGTGPVLQQDEWTRGGEVVSSVDVGTPLPPVSAVDVGSSSSNIFRPSLPAEHRPEERGPTTASHKIPAEALPSSTRTSADGDTVGSPIPADLHPILLPADRHPPGEEDDGLDPRRPRRAGGDLAPLDTSTPLDEEDTSTAVAVTEQTGTYGNWL